MKNSIALGLVLTAFGAPSPAWADAAAAVDVLAVGATTLEDDVPPGFVGEIMASAFSPVEVARAYPKFFRVWMPADGRDAPADSVYARMKGGATPKVPDLRGLFLRGLNQFDSGQPAVRPEQADPDSRTAVSFQVDALQDHTHDTEHGGGSAGQRDSAAGTGPNRRASAPSYSDRRVLLNLGVRDLPNQRSVAVTSETRPKNAAVYYYVRINN